jgi:hypothetical protein
MDMRSFCGHTRTVKGADFSTAAALFRLWRVQVDVKKKTGASTPMRILIVLIPAIVAIAVVFTAAVLLIRAAQSDPHHKRGEDSSYPQHGGA